MAALNQKVNELIEIVNETMDEYFDQQYSTLFAVLVPPLAEVPPTISGGLLKLIAIMEAVLVLAYGAAAFFLSVGEATRRKRAEAKEGTAGGTADGMEGLPKREALPQNA